MSVIYEYWKEVRGRPFYHQDVPESLAMARECAGESGRVASAPDVLMERIGSARANKEGSLPRYGDEWSTAYMTLTEEGVGRTKQRKNVAYIGHGGMIFSTPERIRKAYDDGLLDGSAIPTEKEFNDLLEGRTPNGEVPVYTLREFLGAYLSQLPARYVIVTDLDDFRSILSGVHEIESLRDSPLFIARAGGFEIANAYLEEATHAYIDKPFGRDLRYGNHNRFRAANHKNRQSWLLAVGASPLIGLAGFPIQGGNNITHFLAIPSQETGSNEGEENTIPRREDFLKHAMRALNVTKGPHILEDFARASIDFDVFKESVRRFFDNRKP